MKPYYETKLGKLYHGDSLSVLKTIPDESIQCCITSPPYWGLRDYGIDGQLGLEKTPELYVEKMVEIFREIRRVLRSDGTLWLNLGDSYWGSGCGPSGNFCVPDHERLNNSKGRKYPNSDGLKPKDLIGIPWRVALALQADGWYLRSDIIWAKPNPMPESVTDRPTKAHEYLFLLTKSARYYYDNEAIKEKADTKPHKMGGIQTSSDRNDGDRQNVVIGDGFRNKRTVWTIPTKPFPKAHFATFPPALIEPCILAGCPKGGDILDPFGGAMTTAITAHKHGRKFVMIELSKPYIDDIGIPRIKKSTEQLKLFN